MSKWKKIVSAVWGLTLAACVYSDEKNFIELLDGKAVSKVALAGDTFASFDGNSELVIEKAGVVLRLPARTPSILEISPGHSFALLNFGDGSGQVYDIAVYRLSDGQELELQQFRSSLSAHASTHGCSAPPDAASIIFKRWLSDKSIEVSTEDFSRTTKCSALNRSWTIDLRQNAKG